MSRPPHKKAGEDMRAKFLVLLSILAIFLAGAATAVYAAPIFLTVWAPSNGFLTCKSTSDNPYIDVTYRSASEVEFICKAY